MAFLIETNLWCLVLAFLIGFATGAWIWARRRHRISLGSSSDGPVSRTLERTPASLRMEQPGAADAVLDGGGTVAAAEGGLFLTAPQGVPDDLKRLKGVGPKLEGLLGEIGVYHYHQIAKWSDDEVTIVDERLGIFKGRIDRDRWREQARLLAEGRLDEFERLFGGGQGG